MLTLLLVWPLGLLLFLAFSLALLIVGLFRPNPREQMERNLKERRVRQMTLDHRLNGKRPSMRYALSFPRTHRRRR